MESVLLISPRDFMSQLFMQLKNVTQLDHQFDQLLFVQTFQSVVETRILRFLESDQVGGELSHFSPEAVVCQGHSHGFGFPPQIGNPPKVWPRQSGNRALWIEVTAVRRMPCELGSLKQDISLTPRDR